MTRRTVRLGRSLLVAGVLATVLLNTAPSAAATRREPPRAAHRLTPHSSLGTQICSSNGGFAFFMFGNYNGVDNDGYCYDGGEGTISLPSNDSGQLLVTLDNQTGHRIWVSGITEGGATFNFCYDRGYSFVVGPPVDGGSGYENLVVYGLSEGDTSDCTGVPTSSIGTSEPYTSPWVDQHCATGDVQGGHVFITTSLNDLAFEETNYWCYNDTPATYDNSLPSGLPVLEVANGTGHELLISGTNFSTCVSNNHVIDPVGNAYDTGIIAISVTNGPADCPS